VIRDDDLRYPQLLQIFYLASNVTFRTFGWDVFHSPANKELAENAERITQLEYEKNNRDDYIIELNKCMDQATKALAKRDYGD